MFILYDFIFIVFAVCSLPVYMLKRKFHKGFLSRFGNLPAELKFDRPIWIHAVSVGEMIAVRPFIDELRKCFPGKKLVISTVTATGNAIAASQAQEGDTVLYLPFDIRYAVKKFVERINPLVFIAAETEIWPNLITYLYKKDIPFVVINGRISDGSFQRYRAVRFLLKPVLEKISLFCVQGETDRKRLVSLGLPGSKIKITGNIKFDISIKEVRAEALTERRRILGLDQQYKLLTAGSTHPGEEEILLDVYRALRESFPDLKLLIAPRHPDRAKDIEKIVAQYGFRPVCVSGLPKEGFGLSKPELPGKPQVYILDTIGELLFYYALSEIIFVGGSLIRKGGHNILEPAALSKPVIFGPHMFNFRDIASLFIEREAALAVRSADDLKTHIRFLLNNPLEARRLGEAAKNMIAENQGATVRSLEFVKGFVDYNS